LALDPNIFSFGKLRLLAMDLLDTEELPLSKLLVD
jgi:hypothetical protein